jgi:hypothetical protein
MMRLCQASPPETLPEAITPALAARLQGWVGAFGYASSEPGSQRSPVPLLPGVPDVGDFVGIVANHRSLTLANQVLRAAERCPGGAKLVALKTYFGAHRLVPDLRRSDHAPFWAAGIPALMWTDTAEFRNPNYHAPTDTPDTLDYAFMARVARLLHASVTTSGGSS